MRYYLQLRDFLPYFGFCQWYVLPLFHGGEKGCRILFYHARSVQGLAYSHAAFVHIVDVAICFVELIILLFLGFFASESAATTVTLDYRSSAQHRDTVDSQFFMVESLHSRGIDRVNYTLFHALIKLFLIDVGVFIGWQKGVPLLQETLADVYWCLWLDVVSVFEPAGRLPAE